MPCFFGLVPLKRSIASDNFAELGANYGQSMPGIIAPGVELRCAKTMFRGSIT